MKNSKKNILYTLGALSASCFAQNHPNVIMFMVDDMGWQDTSVPFWTECTPFNNLYHTPNMERLAAQGMKFTQAYACSVSSPTRVSFLTGMNAARHRVTNWTLYKNTSTDARNPELEFPEWNVNGITPYGNLERAIWATTLPELLRQSGYHTIHCGKAHFGAIGTPGCDPLNLGFNVNLAGHATGAPGSYLAEDEFGNNTLGPWGVPGLQEFYGSDMFLTEALTQKALRELDKVPNKEPFFLYMSHYAVHAPYKADKRFINKYREQGLNETEAQYAALVEGMDKSLGDIMDYLDMNYLADNTIIIFMSDNGGLSANGRGGEAHTHNRPLASGKGSAYEGGIREPMIVKWPGVTTAASVCNDYLIIEDFFPTILEMTGVKQAKTIQPVDGISFLPLLKQQQVPNGRKLYWHYPNNWGASGPGIGASSTIRKDDWKLVYFHQDGRFELFNIREDIGEHNDLSLQNPQKVKELAKDLEEYLVSIDAQMPTYRSTEKTVPYPYTRLLSR